MTALFAAHHTSPALSGDRFTVLYRIIGSEQEARERAEDILYEQTVEFPPDLVPAGPIRDGIVGKLEDFTVRSCCCEALVSYAVETAGEELPQLLTVLFGNISIKPGIRIEEITLPDILKKSFYGPRFGIQGIRRLAKVQRRPLLCSALKPMGLSPSGLAELAGRFTDGGIDIIKDDHGLANQPFSLYRERVRSVGRMVTEVNARRSGSTIYAPNITAPFDQLLDRAYMAKEAGAGMLLIPPGIVGLDALRVLAKRSDLNLPIMAHPAFLGSYVTSPESGISHAALFGTLMRIAGADASVYPNWGGRFSFSKEECLSIARACTVEDPYFPPIFPAPGGGMSLERAAELHEAYGENALFLIGGGLFRGTGDVAANVRQFRHLVGG